MEISEMKSTLTLIRHAEAVDRIEAEDDFQRGLSDFGRETCARLSDQLIELGVEFDAALVSPAWRTQETYRCLLGALGSPMLIDPMALYHASTEMLERAALEALPTSPRIVIIGHNPGIGGFAHKLAAKCQSGSDLPRGYPPASTVVFELNGDGLDQPTLIKSFSIQT
jgi:phosphohistidine phosphatase